MVTDLKEQRISDALYLLSRGNYWDSIKIAYDILINEVFIYAKTEKGYKQHEIEKKGKEILCILHDFLIEKQVENFYPVLSEIRLLTIFFNNYSREALKANAYNQKVKVLTLNLIGLLKFLSQANDKSKYHFGGISSLLKNEIQNNVTEELYKATDPYFEIRYESINYFNEDFWKSMDKFDPSLTCSVFTQEEFDLLKNYRDTIDTAQFYLKKDELDVIERIWENDLSIDSIITKLHTQYCLQLLNDELNEFRRADNQSGKYNVYSAELEKGFHKNIYPYLTKSENRYDLVISELNSSNVRHDIVLYKAQNSFSALIELKVNDLSTIKKDLDQLIEYLTEIEDRKFHFMEAPSVAVLAVYYIGKERLKEINLNTKIDPHLDLRRINDHTYFLYHDLIRKAILISLFNGKAKD